LPTARTIEILRGAAASGERGPQARTKWNRERVSREEFLFVPQMASECVFSKLSESRSFIFSLKNKKLKAKRSLHRSFSP
jgi:hypothetical protein